MKPATVAVHVIKLFFYLCFVGLGSFNVIGGLNFTVSDTALVRTAGKIIVPAFLLYTIYCAFQAWCHWQEIRKLAKEEGEVA